MYSLTFTVSCIACRYPNCDVLLMQVAAYVALAAASKAAGGDSSGSEISKELEVGALRQHGKEYGRLAEYQQLLLEAAQILFFCLQLPTSATSGSEAVMIVPGIGAGTVGVRADMWQALVTCCTKMGADDLARAMADEALTHLASLRGSKLFAALQAVSSRRLTPDPARGTPTRTRTERRPRLKVIYLKARRWPGPAFTVSSASRFSPELVTAADRTRIPLKRGKTHAFHVGRNCLPVTVEQLVIEALSTDLDIVELLAVATRAEQRHSGLHAGDKRTAAEVVDEVYPASVDTSLIAARCADGGIAGSPADLQRFFFDRLNSALLASTLPSGYIPRSAALAAQCVLNPAPTIHVIDTSVGQLTSVGGTAWRAIHGENSFWTTLFGILMWDVLFEHTADASCVWKHPWQVAPFDLSCPDFFSVRRVALTKRLLEIASASSCSLAKCVSRVYDSHGTKLAHRIRWDLFDKESLCECVHAAGPFIVHLIVSHIAQDYDNNITGLPDVVAWRPEPCDECCWGNCAVSGATVVSTNAAGNLIWTTSPEAMSSFTADALKYLRTKAAIQARPGRGLFNTWFAMVEVKSENDTMHAHQETWLAKLADQLLAAIIKVNVLDPELRTKRIKT